VDREFIEDDFNLTDLRNKVEDYDHTLDILLDAVDDDSTRSSFFCVNVIG
jgi:hypothetical protein